MTIDPAADRQEHRRRYEALVASIGLAIHGADPIRLLETGAPRDEYDSEIGTIVPRVIKAASSLEVQSMVHEEFARWFGADISGPVGAYEVPAQAIWRAVLEFRHVG